MTDTEKIITILKLTYRELLLLDNLIKISDENIDIYVQGEIKEELRKDINDLKIKVEAVLKNIDKPKDIN